MNQSLFNITELDIYNICHGTYEADYDWTYLFQGATDDDSYVGVKRVGEIDVVAFRGSATIEDWVRNFDPLETYHEGLGWIADGFVRGINAPFANLASIVGSNWICTGHSRGAAEATLYAAMMALVGRPPMLLMPLAPPRTGGETLRGVLAPIKTRAYANKRDPVLDVPPWCDHPYPLIRIDEMPAPDDPWGPAAPHHSELYGRAISKLNPMPVYQVMP